MIRVQFELGGKDPVYVRATSTRRPPPRRVADGAFYNTGQSCCAVERIYVHEKIYDPFVDAFVACQARSSPATRSPTAPTSGRSRARRSSQVLEEQVADAVKKGAKLLTRRQARRAGKGNYFEPTVLTDVTTRMAVMRDESLRADHRHPEGQGRRRGACALMNDTDYGLTAGVYTRTGGARAAALARSTPAPSTGTAATASARACRGAAAATRASARRSRRSASRPSCSRRPGTCARPERHPLRVS